MNKESLGFDLVYWKPKAKVGMILLYNARRTRKKSKRMVYLMYNLGICHYLLISKHLNMPYWMKEKWQPLVF